MAPAVPAPPAGFTPEQWLAFGRAYWAYVDRWAANAKVTPPERIPAAFGGRL